VYLRVLLRGFGYTQNKPTEIWEDNASCIKMSENLTNSDRLGHVDIKVHYLRDLVRDGHVKLVKYAGPQNVSDALTKILARRAFEKHREYMWSALFSLLSLVQSILKSPLEWPISFSCQGSFLCLSSLGKRDRWLKVSSICPHKGRVK